MPVGPTSNNTGLDSGQGRKTRTYISNIANKDVYFEHSKIVEMVSLHSKNSQVPHGNGKPNKNSECQEVPPIIKALSTQVWTVPRVVENKDVCF